jgi:diguanylate cyclase (GGDEF)-like protein
VLRRPADLAARYGGEELAAVLPETDAEGALSLAEAVRSAIRDLAIPHAASARGIVTISAGVATRAGKGGDSAADLVANADHALYAAKAAGRDCVVANRPRLVGPASGPLRSSPERLRSRG